MTSVHLLNQPVVLDLGSGLTKAGYAGTPDPSVVVGSLAGRPKLPKVLPTPESSTASVTDPTSSYVVGTALPPLSGILALSYPLQSGVVKDWSAAEALWRHVVHDALSVTPGDHPFLITEAPHNPRTNRDKLAEFFFETLNAPALHIALPPVLALFASGRTSGLVLDCGDTVTSAVPVAHGHCDVHALRRLDFAGRDITSTLLNQLRRAGAPLLSTSSEWQAVRRMKERLAFVSADPVGEERRFQGEVAPLSGKYARNFQLPDGNTITIASERFRAPEILFRPQHIGYEGGGVVDAVTSAIESVDIDLRRSLYSSVVLAGGSTKFPGFALRLLNELRRSAPPESKVRIHAPPDRLFSAFTGGTILAALSSTFRAMAVTRSEYYEHGASVVHRKQV